MRAFEIRGDQLVEALRGRLQDVAPFARRYASVVDQKIEMRETLARKCDQPFAIGGGGDVALKDCRAGFRMQAVGGIAAASVCANDIVRARELGGDGPADAAAGAGYDGSVGQ